MNTYPAYISKHNLHHKKEVILLIIPNEEGWYYLAIKKCICIIRRNNVKACWCFFLFELPSFV